MISDIRYALRMLAKNPGFACVVIFTLALGIGANAAIFSMLDQVLLQSLPVANPDQLAVLSSYDPKDGPDIGSSFSYPMYQDLRDKNDVFSGVIVRGGTQMNVSYGDRTERVRGELVSGNFFEVLGVRPWAGRLFTQDDDRTPGAHPVAVLSYAYWESRFGKDASLIGKTILVNEHALTVIGVTPPGFYGVSLSNNPDVRVTMMMTPVFNPLPPTRLQSRRHQWLSVLARRKPEVSQQQAQASLDVLYRQLREAEAEKLPASVSSFDREQFLAQRIAVLPGDQGLRHMQVELKTSLLLLFGATCAVLLILCANLANLMMARATVRAQETAVRLALGAGRLRLLRQWLTEGVVLAAIVGVVKDVQYINLRQSLRRHFYLPTTQEKVLLNLTLHVKTATDPSIVAESLRAELKAIDPHLPLYDVKTLSTEIDESLVQERLVTWLSSAFGLLATLLTALGLYGVLTFSVARRTREIGIRVALGAQRRDVFKLIMIRGVVLVGVGVAVGVGASMALSRVLDSLLFGVKPNNVATLVLVSVGLVVIALLACYLPARRATKVDPLVALRYE